MDNWIRNLRITELYGSGIHGVAVLPAGWMTDHQSSWDGTEVPKLARSRSPTIHLHISSFIHAPSLTTSTHYINHHVHVHLIMSFLRHRKHIPARLALHVHRSVSRVDNTQ